jgi:outer membrane lipoprotein carrier protein
MSVCSGKHLNATVVCIVLLTIFGPPAAGVQTRSLTALLDGVEENLERMDDLSADFLQTYQSPLNRTMQEAGRLYLRRPRMMRWEYQTPEEKLFVTDGDIVYLYVPGEGQVNRDQVSDTFDDRVPIMFLLGRSNLQSEFTRISLLGTPPKVAGAQVLRMYPRRESDVEEVELEVDPTTFDIRRLQLAYVDGSRSEFIFDRVETNRGLDRDLFEFLPPPDVEIVEGIGQ